MSRANICFDCQRACGGCSWSQDFTPVPGWTAKPVKLKQSPGEPIDTYHITGCPLFLPHPPKEEVRIERKPKRNGRKRPCVCVETGQVFEGVVDAAASVGIDPRRISVAIYSGGKSGGYHWRHATTGEFDELL